MDELSVIQKPTLIVAAGKERIGHASAYQEMNKKISGSELHYYDTSAHNICDGYASRCTDDLLDFLKRCG
jgi:3-oxoadipate enol-lactonase